MKNFYRSKDLGNGGDIRRKQPCIKKFGVYDIDLKMNYNKGCVSGDNSNARDYYRKTTRIYK